MPNGSGGLEEQSPSWQMGRFAERLDTLAKAIDGLTASVNGMSVRLDSHIDGEHERLGGLPDLIRRMESLESDHRLFVREYAGNHKELQKDFEVRMEKNEGRLSKLENWQANLTGKMAVISSIGGIVGAIAMFLLSKIKW